MSTATMTPPCCFRACAAPLRPNNWRKRHFSPAVAQAGLAPLSPHDLRHTAASFLIAEAPTRGCSPRYSDTATLG